MPTFRAVWLTAGFILLFSRGAFAASSPPASSGDGWALYDRGFAEASAGHDSEALAIFERLVKDFPESPAAPFALEMIRLFEARRTGVITSPDARVRLLGHGLTPPVPMPPMDLGARLRAERPTALARAEVVIAQTLNGIAFGFEVSQMASVSDIKGEVLITMVGGGAGLGLSLFLTRHGITPGHALALNSGTLWGAVNGLLGVSLANGLSGQGEAGLVAATQFGGLALGQLGWTLFHPSAGDVSLVNSGGFWTGGVAIFLVNAADPHLSGTAMATTALVAVDGGLVLGGFLAHEFPMSRGRTLLIDSGGVLGTLFGLGVAVLAGQTPPEHNSTFFGVGAAGTVVGLATAAILSRHWDLPDAPPMRLSVLPNVGGGASLGVACNF